MEKNIVLIGMPGAGKSTIGVVLAKTLGRTFVDTDLVIQKREDNLLQQMIDEVGMERFLDIEKDAILSIDVERSVIATGGSVVYRKESMEYLKKKSICIYLELSYEEIEKRINNITTRGIAKQKGQTLKDIYNERIPLYKQYADITINCEHNNLEKTIQAIQDKIRD